MYTLKAGVTGVLRRTRNTVVANRVVGRNTGELNTGTLTTERPNNWSPPNTFGEGTMFLRIAITDPQAL
jgi:hypothetical protein